MERQKEKQKKKHNWSNKGGYIAPIFVPPTPNGELAAQLRNIAEREAEAGVQFRIVETGGIPCRTGQVDGGNCRSCGVNYLVECQLCPPGQRGLYISETAHNLYTRGK